MNCQRGPPTSSARRLTADEAVLQGIVSYLRFSLRLLNSCPHQRSWKVCREFAQEECMSWGLLFSLVPILYHGHLCQQCYFLLSDRCLPSHQTSWKVCRQWDPLLPLVYQPLVPLLYEPLCLLVTHQTSQKSRKLSHLLAKEDPFLPLVYQPFPPLVYQLRYFPLKGCIWPPDFSAQLSSAYSAISRRLIYCPQPALRLLEYCPPCNL
mmetsp:Transcript_146490/g.255502  ORF Transcript_146490/g.255502 Transcript_146490/m.255502 type:complete len:208 (+) Transcript_146490:458-1081(+)